MPASSALVNKALTIFEVIQRFDLNIAPHKLG